MAIPPIEISTRKLDVAPSLQYFKSSKAEDARVVGGTISDVATGLNRIVEVQRRANEREAEYAVQQADNFVRNGWLGTDTQDEATGEWRHNPGVADRTWEQMRDDKTTPLDEMRRLQKAVREQEFYTNLTPDQRKVFERKWLFKSDEHSRTAQQHHQRLSLARIQDETRRTIEMRGEEVGRVYGADDLVYTKVAGRNALLNWADMQGTALNERSRVMLDDPRCNFDDIAKSQGWDGKTRAQKLHEYRKVALGFDINRITALTKAAAGNRGLGAGLLATPEGCLLKAAQITNGLNGNGFGVRPDGTKKGTGWCGVLRNANGDFVTEYSMQSDAVKVDGKRIDFPTLVPGLTAEERQLVLDKSAGKEVDAEKYAAVEQKAVDHAKKMISEGKSVWRDSGTGAAHINDAQRNALLDIVGEAAREMRRVRDHEQSLNGKKLDAELDEKQWHFIENPMGEQFDEGGYLAQVDQAVRSGAISRAQGLTLFGRYQKMRKDRDELAEDLKNPSVFREKSDPMVWVRLKQMIADAERNNTPAAQLEDAVARAKTSLSSKEYFALWHEARQKRDAEDDRITSQVFAEFLKVDEDTVKTAIDPSKRTSKAGAEAVGALLGSPNAEYERSWRIHNPDFTIEDVDEAVRLVRDYVKSNPGNSEGARQLLENLVKPHAEAARARTFRDRIQAVRRSRQWSVEKAFAQ